MGQKTAWLLAQRLRTMRANGGELPVASFVQPITIRNQRQTDGVMVITARRVAVKKALGLTLWRSDTEGLPRNVQHAINAIEPKRYQSARRRGLVTMEPPAHVWGFQPVMKTIRHGHGPFGEDAIPVGAGTR